MYKPKLHKISYPKILSKKPFVIIWKKYCCSAGWHLWRNIICVGNSSNWESALVCDSCKKRLIIS